MPLAGPATGALLFNRTLGARASEFVNVLDHGVKGDATTDDTDAFGDAWAVMAASFVDVSTEDYVTKTLYIPPGEYRIDGSINWTGLKARNVHVMAHGAVFHGYGSGKNVIDLIGSRWVQIHGLEVLGNDLSPPKCGILIGPEGTAASGNNAFWGCNFTGHYTKTAFWNIGSETTTYFRTKFYNSDTDIDASAYLAEGLHLFGAASDYQTLRSPGTAVSFTLNSFYSCDLRNAGGGPAVAIEAAVRWLFDEGCYFLSFNDANVRLYQRTARNHGITLRGHYESAQTDQPSGSGNLGVKYVVEIVGNGSSTSIGSLSLICGTPHARLAAIKATNVGVLALRDADIRINRMFTDGAVVFDAPSLILTGRLDHAVSAELNLSDITAFNGFCYTRDLSLLTYPIGGNHILISEDN